MSCRPVRYFSTSLHSAKHRGGSGSDGWLRRHVKDKYVLQSSVDNYRARSAYKLLEIDKSCRVLRRGVTVVECGAAPGAWTQVAADRVGQEGLVVSCDLLHMEPVPGAVTLSGRDFTSQQTWTEINNIVGDRNIDLVLSDMAPNVSGNSSMDHDAITNLVYSVLKFSLLNASPGSSLLTKTFNGANHAKLIKDFEACYDRVKIYKPPSSRSESSELFIFARNLRKRNK